jgi:hypothetical protein
MEIHTLKFEALTRNASQVQTSIVPAFQMEMNIAKPRELTEVIRAADNTVLVAGGTAENYMEIFATYQVDDPASGAVAGDKAPFVVKWNGDTVDHPQKGVTIYTGPVTELRLSTPSTVAVEFKIIAG